MRIALLIGSLQKGGSERVMANLAGHLAKAGHKITLVTQYKAETEYELTEDVSRVFSEITEEECSRSRVINFYRRFAKLRRIWKQEKPDVILSFIGKNNLMAVLTSRFLGIPVIVSVRGEPELEYDSKMLRLCARLFFRFADGVVLQTEPCLNFFPKTVRNKAVILDNPLNPDFIRPIVPYEEREMLIAAVGRVDANKNHELIIDAAAALLGESELEEDGRGFAGECCKDERSGEERFEGERSGEKKLGGLWKLVIYGEGELREALCEKVRSLGLEDRIFLPGAVADVAGHIEKASIFVLSSDSEGLPNTVMEAMALGIPVISSDCPSGGPARLIQHGKNGLLFQPGDGEQLKRSLRELMENRELGARLSSEAVNIQVSCSPDNVNRAWEEYLCGHCRGKKDRR